VGQFETIFGAVPPLWCCAVCALKLEEVIVTAPWVIGVSFVCVCYFSYPIRCFIYILHLGYDQLCLSVPFLLLVFLMQSDVYVHNSNCL
jgi:hypothetical protein